MRTLRLVCILASLFSGLQADAEQVRLVAFGGATGNNINYAGGEGARLLKAIKPDIAFLQEFKKGNNSSDLDSFVADTFGGDFTYRRSNLTGNGDIPTAVISRYPILSSGEWADPTVTTRNFLWTCIDIPGPKNLWAISVHFSTAVSSRSTAATSLVQQITTSIPAGDYLAIGGNFNINDRTEPAITTLSSVVVTTGPHPADQASNENTNPSRSRPYDSVFVNAAFNSTQTPASFGGSTFSSGLILDPRVFTPASAFSPATVADGTALRHFPVIKDFNIPSLPFQITSSSFTTFPTRRETITFNSSPGLTYRIQVSASLLANSWSTLGTVQATTASTTITVVPASPTAGQFSDAPLATSAKRFYRIARP